MNADFLLDGLCREPAAEALDALKWLYQSEYGCGHMLPAHARCARRIAQEVAQTQPDATAPAFTPLGDGLCRLNLHHPIPRALPPERIARMMRVTQRHARGTPEGLAGKLALLRTLAQTHSANTAVSGGPRLPFTAAALDAAVRDWEAGGGAPPSHSARYRAACAPAYRVVLRGFGEALPVLAAIEDSLAQSGRALLVLDGDCASGKTTLAALLAALYRATVFHMDDFFLPVALRTPARLAEPGGNVHVERFRERVLEGLLQGGPVAYEAYRCATGRLRRVQARPAAVTVIEGSYALHPALLDAYGQLRAIRALMTVEPAEQLRRISLRNGPQGLARFQNEWIPLEKRYFEAYHDSWRGAIALRSERHAEDERAEEAYAP